jgi:hypothetical protein
VPRESFVVVLFDDFPGLTACKPLPVQRARTLCALAADFGSEVHISQE